MFRKLLASFFLIFGLFVYSSRSVKAIVDPLTSPNNKYGIHILGESDLEDAAKLVNSSGGDYGYVTFVIREDEKDTKKWQTVFDKARVLHLIPIVRIASKQTENGWSKLSVDEIDGWVTFLNSLNWVTQNRYVIVGNEPNHATEWGGNISPEGYADYLKIFRDKLKNVSQDFFIISAGFDASAPDNRTHMSEDTYIRRMISHDPDVFNRIDGWSSHSYPNPNFSGLATAEGKGTLHTYRWEKNLLQSLGVTKKLPIFITETGWAHSMGKDRSEFLDLETVTERFLFTFQNNWNDPQIVAITPFILNYNTPPFDKFSWKAPEGNFYDFYYKIRDLPKVKGEPKQVVSSEVISFLSPPVLAKEQKTYGLIYLKNTGQTIWSGEQTLSVTVLGREITVKPLLLLADAEPGEKTLALYELEE